MINIENIQDLVNEQENFYTSDENSSTNENNHNQSKNSEEIVDVGAVSEIDVKTATKAYENHKFMSSRDARTLRILSEYLHPEQYLHKYNIKNTIVFFGSARSISSVDFNQRKKDILDKLSNSVSPNEIKILQIEMQKMNRLEFTSKYYDDGVKLAKKLSEWSKSLTYEDRFYICTGGGPGMMEAANKGAYLADMPTIGLNITLPFEQIPNQFITPELNFQFHYFFMRKFWFMYQAKAMIAMPGGYGTLDELMELLTLEQTNVMSKRIPIILYGEDFWRKTVNFEYLAEIGMINYDDLNLFQYVNDVDSAFELITSNLKENLHNY
jgi:uncharacterized protein (TIGR00730 family)